MKRISGTGFQMKQFPHRSHYFLVGAFLLLIALTLSGRLVFSTGRMPQTTVNLDPVADATVDETEPDVALGLEPTLEVFNLGQYETGRSLIRFNLAEGVPSEAIIDSATLNLYVENCSADGPIDFTAYIVTAEWAESEVTWNTQPATGTVSSVNSVTNYEGWKQLDVTEVVQAWHNAPHYGLLLVGVESFVGYDYTFTSADAAENQPVLDVSYHLPAASDYVFSGHVYLGAPPDEDVPLVEARLELYGDGDASIDDGAGVLLTSAISDGTGSFEMDWEGEPFAYYHLIQFGPPDTYPNGAETSLPGAIEASNGLTFADPGSGVYDDLMFWNAEWPEGCNDLLVNGDLESGELDPWGSFATVELGEGRDGGVGVLIGGEVDSEGEIWQPVTIPAEVESAVMSFWWKADNAIEKPNDVLHVLIQHEGGDELFLWLPASGELGTWRYGAVDLI
ncbi:MAG: DNRLRE domain-containing protein, partial [Anaerolineales bacterium]|nr:DNRLRE domain-containing protein [Anaerolineales bacterium]